jgi:hypothetical protein
MRGAKARRLAAVAMVSTSQAVCSRSRPQVLTRRGVVRGRSRLRRVSGAATTSACSWRWASVAAWTAEGRAASRTERGTVTGRAGLGELVAAQGLAGPP